MNLPPLIQAFVLHFGEMGSRWGINRTVGQIYALLYAADRPLNAEQITEALGIARSNTSMGLKELDTWRLIRRLHLPDDRRDYFAALEDPWAIVRTLAEERRKREVDPTLSVLRDLLMQAPASEAERHAQDRLRALNEAIELLTGWADEVQKLPDERIVALLRLGAGVAKVLDAGDRLKLVLGGRAKAPARRKKD
ncbi:GbsR/MarR family transcriptional regulator [Paracraurococcus ruber]|uniref:HTH-type transcriptional regulator n=1 Tax=Paracraurococcus ruber TaxID=77675 RepID=A0ABS1D363_9PROT|nr:GbsR/MarR family transcriptional regulator [Paracraurococcus ruber]MBK1660991.1 ArsR family transcriptional regulator [Paracraurococcus ruber]TDG27142.1 GbsR/MarR family transcriptional regulator [Paracraurococcus ruber]